MSRRRARVCLLVQQTGGCGEWVAGVGGAGGPSLPGTGGTPGPVGGQWMGTGRGSGTPTATAWASCWHRPHSRRAVLELCGCPCGAGSPPLTPHSHLMVPGTRLGLQLLRGSAVPIASAAVSLRPPLPSPQDSMWPRPVPHPHLGPAAALAVGPMPARVQVQLPGSRTGEITAGWGPLLSYGLSGRVFPVTGWPLRRDTGQLHSAVSAG